MYGIAKPDLIVDGYASPHGFAMKPSHAKMLQNADLIFWVGEDLESFLEKPLSSIAKKAEKIELMETKELQVLKFRERNILTNMIMTITDMTIMVKKKMITAIMGMMTTVKEDDHDHDDHGKKKMTMTMTMMTTVKRKMITTTIMTIMVKKRMIMTTTDMTIMMDMRMVNLIHTFGWTQLMQKLC